MERAGVEGLDERLQLGHPAAARGIRVSDSDAASASVTRIWHPSQRLFVESEPVTGQRRRLSRGRGAGPGGLLHSAFACASVEPPPTGGHARIPTWSPAPDRPRLGHQCTASDTLAWRLGGSCRGGASDTETATLISRRRLGCQDSDSDAGANTGLTARWQFCSSSHEPCFPASARSRSAMGPCPCPSEMLASRLAKPISSAKPIHAMVGSAPVDRMKMSGTVAIESCRRRPPR